MSVTQLGLQGEALHKAFDQVVTEGGLTVQYPNGLTREYGQNEDGLWLSLHTNGAVRRAMINPGMIGVDYIAGDVDIAMDGTDDYVPPIKKMSQLALASAGNLPRMVQNGYRMYRKSAEHLRRDPNDPASHYDRGDDLFDLFLDKESWTYSAAYFDDDPVSMTLAKAQRRKRSNILDKLEITSEGDGKNILEHGIGWGHTAVEAAERNPNNFVVGTTLSHNQLAAAKKLAAERGVTNVDFRYISSHELSQLEEFQEFFDVVYSVGMYEHVGDEGQEEYFEDMSKVTKDGGMVAVHTITDELDLPPGPFVRNYTFQGGDLPTIDTVVRYGRLHGFRDVDVESRRPHYEVTADRWGTNHDNSRDMYYELWKAGKIKHHRPDVSTPEQGFRFDSFYLGSIAAGFSEYGTLDVIQYVASNGARADKPFTRTHML